MRGRFDAEVVLPYLLKNQSNEELLELLSEYNKITEYIRELLPTLPHNMRVSGEYGVLFLTGKV